MANVFSNLLQSSRDASAMLRDRLSASSANVPSGDRLDHPRFVSGGIQMRDIQPPSYTQEPVQQPRSAQDKMMDRIREAGATPLGGYKGADSLQGSTAQSSGRIMSQLEQAAIPTSPIGRYNAKTITAGAPSKWDVMKEACDNKLSYEITSTNSVYSLTPVPGTKDRMIIRGGSQLPESGVEIYKPDVLPHAGDRMTFRFTDNPMNGRFANGSISPTAQADASLIDSKGIRHSMDAISTSLNGSMITEVSDIVVQTGNSSYILQAIPGRQDVMSMFGGKLPHPVEIYSPNVMPGVGEKLSVMMTNNPLNKDFASRTLDTSTIRQIQTSSDYSNGQQRCVTMPSDTFQNDTGALRFTQPTVNNPNMNLGYIMQQRASEITWEVADRLGLPDDNHLLISFTPSMSADGVRGFNASFRGMDLDLGNARVLSDVVGDVARQYGESAPNFSELKPMGNRDFVAMNRSFAYAEPSFAESYGQYKSMQSQNQMGGAQLDESYMPHQATQQQQYSL